MVSIDYLLDFFGLADQALPNTLQSELPMLTRGTLAVTDTVSLASVPISSLVDFQFTEDFLKNNFGPGLADIYAVIYPTDHPYYDGTSTITFPGVLIISYQNRYDQLYQNLLTLYDFTRASIAGYASTGNANSAGPLPYEIMTFPVYTSVSTILQAASNDPLAVVIPVSITVSLSSTGADTVVVDYTISVDTGNLSSTLLTTAAFTVDVSTSAPITFPLTLPVDTSSPPTAIYELPADALIFGHPVSDGTNLSSPLPLTFKYHWVGSDYELLWMPTEKVYSIKTTKPPVGYFWTDLGDSSIFDTTLPVTTHPVSVSIASISQDVIDEAEPLFVVTPDFAFPVDSTAFISNPLYNSTNEAIANFVVAADALYIPLVEGDEGTSTLAAWQTFANLIRPSISEAQARYVLFGPILLRADGKLENAGLDLLKNWVANFDVRYHLPPAGLTRGLVGGVTTSYPYLFEDADLNAFVNSRINPIKRTSAGWAVFGTMTLYNDDSSYKGHNYTMVLTRIVKRLILRLLPRALYEVPTRLAEVAGAVERIVNSLNGVTMEILSVTYDPASQTGQIRAKLFLEGVLEAIEFTVAISFQGVEVNL